MIPVWDYQVKKLVQGSKGRDWSSYCFVRIDCAIAETQQTI